MTLDTFISVHRYKCNLFRLEDTDVDAAEPLLVACELYLTLFYSLPQRLVFGILKLPESEALLNHPHDQKGIKNKPAGYSRLGGCNFWP